MAKTRLGKDYEKMLAKLQRRHQLERQLWVVGALRPGHWEPSRYLWMLAVMALEVAA